MGTILVVDVVATIGRMQVLDEWKAMLDGCKSRLALMGEGGMAAKQTKVKMRLSCGQWA